MVDQVLQPLRRALHGIHQYRGIMVDAQRWQTLQPRLNRATQVGLSALLPVLVAQMKLEPGDPSRMIRKRGFHGSGHILLQREAAVDMVVGVDLDNHDIRTVRLDHEM